MCLYRISKKRISKKRIKEKGERGAFGRWRLEVGGKDEGRGTRDEERWTTEEGRKEVEKRRS